MVTMKSYLVVLIILSALVYTEAKQKWTKKRDTHRFNTLTPSRLDFVANLPQVERQSQLTTYLDSILIERPPESQGIKQVREDIIRHIEEIGGWTIELDTFHETVRTNAKVEFVNIVATLNPNAKRRLVLACHYDSKYFPPDPRGRVFLGATDSAVPCAMMLDLIYQLDPLLKKVKDKQIRQRSARKRLKSMNKGPITKRRRSKKPVKDITLQLIFFDGEEAYNGEGAVAEWGSSNNLYGSRHLSQKMKDTLHPPNNKDKTNQLDAIDVLVLLDLIGHKTATFMNHYSKTAIHFQRMQNIESRLKNGQLLSTTQNHKYFQGKSASAGIIMDDQVPFVEKGVPALHLISTPFPSVWHKYDDNRDAIDFTAVEDLSKILRVFVAEYLALNVPPKK
ncbi:glutaminyl-peptide cyclotransferase-like isoform X2 [Ptychodera flava]|uniref:glutaminyl-peptide cyclotransferase-like isoform X2 n=1 Tax=Ptychodera flava TaxID=63121 RepID=UPI003969C102